LNLILGQFQWMQQSKGQSKIQLLHVSLECQLLLQLHLEETPQLINKYFIILSFLYFVFFRENGSDFTSAESEEDEESDSTYEKQLQIDEDYDSQLQYENDENEISHDLFQESPLPINAIVRQVTNQTERDPKDDFHRERTSSVSCSGHIILKGDEIILDISDEELQQLDNSLEDPGISSILESIMDKVGEEIEGKLRIKIFCIKFYYLYYIL